MGKKGIQERQKLIVSGSSPLNKASPNASLSKGQRQLLFMLSKIQKPGFSERGKTGLMLEPPGNAGKPAKPIIQENKMKGQFPDNASVEKILKNKTKGRTDKKGI